MLHKNGHDRVDVSRGEIAIDAYRFFPPAGRKLLERGSLALKTPFWRTRRMFSTPPVARFARYSLSRQSATLHTDKRATRTSDTPEREFVRDTRFRGVEITKNHGAASRIPKQRRARFALQLNVFTHRID